MIKGISYWAFPNGTKIKDAIKLAKNYGFESIELIFDPNSELGINTTKNQCEEIISISKNEGIKISSLCTGMYWDCSLSDPNPSIANQAIENTKKYLEVASWLEVDTILVVPGAVDVFFNPNFEPVDYEECYKNATKSIKNLIPFAEKAGVCMALENVWNKFLISPMEMKQFIDQFDSKFVGAYFDVGNCLLNGFPEHWIKCLNKRIKKVHFKDFKKVIGTAEGFVDLLEGDINWPNVIKALNEIGYNSYVTAEMFPYKDNGMLMVKNTSNAMNDILGK